MATITNSNSTSESCNNNYNIVISVMTIAIIVTILHIFVPQLGGNFFAIISIILLLVSSLFSANAGWQQYLSNRNTNDHDNIKKGIFITPFVEDFKFQVLTPKKRGIGLVVISLSSKTCINETFLSKP